MLKNLTDVIIKVLYIENKDITLLEKRTEVYMKEKKRGITDRRMHHEIYLSDARKVAPEKLKTAIRHPIKRA